MSWVASSPETDEIVTALQQALAEMPDVTRDSYVKAGAMQYKFATLGAVLSAVRPVLAKHGLSIMQTPVAQGEVESTILHSSGQWLTTAPLVVIPNNHSPQGQGSAISFARRYALLSVLCLATEDDDGSSAAQQPEPHPNSDRVKDVVAALKALDATEKEAVKVWADGHSLAPKALLDDEKWLERVETFLTEMTGS
jgi:hypothetical protein